MNPALMNFLERYWGFFVLGIWVAAALLFGLISTEPYGIQENAALGLLLNWTVADNVINPVLILGVPDFRALLFMPIGAYWPGSILAAKVLTLLLAFAAVSMLYHWARDAESKESALLASALLLISPALLAQIDAMDTGPYLLLGFALGAWIDRAYRKKPRYFGGWYFAQMIWVAILITLTPIAVAFPLALAWHWWKKPHEHKKSRHVFIGLAISTIIALLISGGWGNIAWFGNPVEALALALQGSVAWSRADIAWTPGIIAATLLALVVAIDRDFLINDLLGRMLLLATLLGLVMADEAWALIAITIVLYRGVPLLIRWNQSWKKHSFLGQRGLVAALTFVIATFFMLEDKAHALMHKLEAYSPEDELIMRLSNIASDESRPFRVASQWPARTMLATRRDVLPLPRYYDNLEQLEQSLKGLTHLAFDPYDPDNKLLADGIAQLTGATETLTLMKAGIILAVRDHTVELKHYRPPVNPEETTNELKKPDGAASND